MAVATSSSEIKEAHGADRATAASGPKGFASVAAARAIGPLLERYAGVNEGAGMLSAEIVRVMQGLNLFGLYAPKGLGGLETYPVEALQVIEALSYADAPSGWVEFATAVATGTAAGYLPRDGAAKIFGGSSVPIIAGQGAPNGRAVAVEGGFMLSGAWNYGSGIKHAAYAHTGAIIMDGDKPRLLADGSPEVRIFIVPIEKVELGGNWDVMGLRATGSVDYKIDQIFVAEEFTHPMSSRESRASDIFRVGLRGLAVIGHTGFALGVARRLLDEIAAFARSSIGKRGSLGNSERFPEHFAIHEAKLRSARAFVLESWAEIEATVKVGSDVSTRQDILVRLALAHATSVAADIASFAYREAGGEALRGGVIQRFFRDMHGGTQHITSKPAVVLECGKELAGLV